MIEALKSEDIVNRAGGRFKLCALIQRRLVELMEGARPLVERRGRTDLEIVIDEILHEKICIDHESALAALDGVVAEAGALPAAAELL
ncbi:MAG: DNA-directed RNA polymerase subunit omega [Phycisphaerales bacterium]|nr:DNA-directed RNA polymerase subunit omega [Phycisphaerales bacterium]